MEPTLHPLASPNKPPSEERNMNQAKTASFNSEPSTLLTSSTSKPNMKPLDESPPASTHQPFRFSDLHPELRDEIYVLATYPGTRERFIGEGPEGAEFVTIKPLLTAGLSSSPTARALSQVSRTIRKESMKAFYSTTTFLVPEVKSSMLDLISRPPRGQHDPMDEWAKTWGVLAGPHIRSLWIEALLGLFQAGVVLISLDSGTHAASYTGAKDYSRIEESVLNATALRAFSSQKKTAAEKLATFLDDLRFVKMRSMVDSHRKLEAQGKLYDPRRGDTVKVP